jgi:hypothetical protein
MIVIGIDLGVTGAVSGVSPSGSVQVEDLPITVSDAGEKRLDARGLMQLLRSMVPAGEAGLIVTEDVRVRQIAGRAMSHKTETALVGLRYAVQAVADVARLQVRTVQPQTWKRFYDIREDKNGSVARQKAMQLFPIAAYKLGRVKDHNRAESLLIANYGARVMA